MISWHLFLPWNGGRLKRIVEDLLKQVRVISGKFDAISGWRWRSLYLRNGGRKLFNCSLGSW